MRRGPLARSRVPRIPTRCDNAGLRFTTQPHQGQKYFTTHGLIMIKPHARTNILHSWRLFSRR